MSTFISEDKHREVLADCIDVPEESPAFPLPINHVGISGKTVWVSLAANKGGCLPFSATILVNLDADRRGIHMSRIEEAITSLHGREFDNLPEYGKLLTAQILRQQNVRYVSLELCGRLPFVQSAPVSRLNSIDTLEVQCKLVTEKTQDGTTCESQIGAGVHHLTACPCTIAYNKALFNRFHDPWPQATHSQRSKTTLRVSPPAGPYLPTFQDLQEVLVSVLHVSQDLLKRPDETELVLKAHNHPQFVEDTVREVARAAGVKLRDTLPQETGIEVHSRSLESIHIHDVECCLATSLGDICAAIPSTKQEHEP